MRRYVVLLVFSLFVFLLLPIERAGASDLNTKVSGSSTSSGKLSRTITDIAEPPPGPGRVRPARAQVSHTVSVTIPGAGFSAGTVAKTMIDSINAQVGSFGFTASFTSLPDSTRVTMTRPPNFCSDESNTIRGVGIVSGDMLVIAEHTGHSCASAEALASAASPSPASVAPAPPLRAQRGAGVPDPANSSIDAHLMVCPAGDLPFHVTLRDINNNPVTNGTVILDFSLCVDFPVCVGPTAYSVDASKRHVWTMTNGLGEATIPVRMGGVCPAGVIRIYTDSGLLGTSVLGSPDQNGDLLVNNADLVILASKVGTGDLSGDFDGDGAVCGSSVNGIDDPLAERIPGFTLRGPWPNILRAGEPATIEYQIAGRADLVLELFDVVGRRVWARRIGTSDAGVRRTEWRVPEGTRPGLYSLRLRSSAGEREARSLIIR